jgi:hypothetical protein
MNRNILAAVDIGGFAVCAAIGAHIAISKADHFTAAGFALAAMAFLLSSFLQLHPEEFDMRALGILQALAYSAAVVILLGITARWVA